MVDQTGEQWGQSTLWGSHKCLFFTYNTTPHECKCICNILTVLEQGGTATLVGSLDETSGRVNVQAKCRGNLVKFDSLVCA